MKYFFPFAFVLFLTSCNSEPKQELSAQELLQLALEKAKEEGLTSEDLNHSIEPETTEEVQPEKTDNNDSIALVLKDWYRDYRIFNDVGVNHVDSIQVNLSGVYKFEEDDYNFKLSLGQSGIHLRGFYCGYTNTKSDCGMESQGVADPYVKGRVLNDTAIIYYYSNYANDFGWAKVYLEDDSTLIWKATKSPDALFIGTPAEAKLKLINQRQEEYEVWPDPDMEGC